MWPLQNGDNRLLFLSGTVAPNSKSVPDIDPKRWHFSLNSERHGKHRQGKWST